MDEHKKRHNELHQAFDELLAGFISAGGSVHQEIIELLEWSHKQTKKPDHTHEEPKQHMAIVGCCYDDHTSYYELAEEHVKTLLETPHDGRNAIVTANGKIASVSSDEEVDFVMVFDGVSHDPDPNSFDEEELRRTLEDWLSAIGKK